MLGVLGGDRLGEDVTLVGDQRGRGLIAAALDAEHDHGGFHWTQMKPRASNRMAAAPILKLGTRRSPLAMAQAQEARTRLCAAQGWSEQQVELVPVTASGDKVQD